MMPIYVARIELKGKVLIEHAEVTVELLEVDRWRGRFLLPSGIALPRKAKLSILFSDGREGHATVDQIHSATSKKAPRLVEISGVGKL
jgi:hypothetical protein